MTRISFLSCNDFRAAGARADEVKGIFAAMLQFHQRAEADGFVRAKFFHGQLFKFGDGGFDFRRLFGLAAREVGGFEAARVVFVLGLAGFMRGLGAGELRGAEINLQFLREPGDDFLDDGAFVHQGKRGWRQCIDSIEDQRPSRLDGSAVSWPRAWLGMALSEKVTATVKSVGPVLLSITRNDTAPVQLRMSR